MTSTLPYPLPVKYLVSKVALVVLEALIFMTGSRGGKRRNVDKALCSQLPQGTTPFIPLVC